MREGGKILANLPRKLLHLPGNFKADFTRFFRERDLTCFSYREWDIDRCIVVNLSNFKTFKICFVDIDIPH